MCEYLSYKFLSKYNIYGNDLARYAIPYYALSVGLEVRFLNISESTEFKNFHKVEGNGGVYEISNGMITYKFNYSRLWTDEQKDGINKYSKHNLKSFLAKLNLDFPESFNFKQSDCKEKILESFTNFPLVVKPIIGSMGKGVFANIRTKIELSDAIEKQKSNFMIEKYITGDEYRVYTVAGEVAAFCKREFANVVGDGNKSVLKLIEEKII